MKKYLTIPICLLWILGALFLGGCSTSAEAPTAAAETTATDVVVPEEPTQAPEEAVLPTDSASQNPSDPDDAGEDVAVNEESYCIDCHTDQQALINTAKPEEAVISENEGEG